MAATMRPRVSPAGGRAVQPDRPQLVVVQRGGRIVGVVTIVAAVLCALLFFAALLRTELAKQQMRLDGLNRSVVMARDHYNDLRHERAFLESPGRLSSEAAKLGMRPGGNVRFIPIDSDIVASVLASTGDLMDRVADEEKSPLDEFGRIKSEVDGVP